MMTYPILEINELSTPLPHKSLAKNIALKNQNGLITYIKGPNGSGKTTLLKKIFSTYQKNLPIFYLPQNDLKEIPISIALEELTDNSSNLLESKKIFQTWNQSSGGEKKRTLLSLMIENLPEKNAILLLDEPFNHLDLESIHLLCDELKLLSHKHWIILVTHHFNDKLSASVFIEDIKWI